MNLTRLLFPAVIMACLSMGARSEPTADGLYAHFSTSLGEFWCRLEFEKAPRTVASFVGLTEGTRDWIDFSTAKIQRRPFYDGLTFHRVVDGFVIQGGSPNGQGTDGPGYQFADEFNPQLRHSKAGILSMANSGRNSNGSQFFVTVTNTPGLDNVHSIFGEVVEGLDVVFAINLVPTDVNDRPVTPVVMNAVRIVRRGSAAEGFDPALASPTLPEVGRVPAALSYSAATTNLTLLLRPRTNYIQHAFFGTNFQSWSHQSFRGPLTQLDARPLIGQPHLFFRVLDGGYEP